MSVCLAREWAFSSILVSDRYQRPIINVYTARTELITEAQDNVNHNCAYGRIKYWMQEVMDGAVLISHDHPDLGIWKQTGSRVLAFPEDPVDQLVGIMIYTKLTAITAPQMLIDRVDISSPLDDDVVYQHHAVESLGPFSQHSWWDDERPTWQVAAAKPRNSKVVALDRQLTWRDLDLEWYQPSETTDAQ